MRRSRSTTASQEVGLFFGGGGKLGGGINVNINVENQWLNNG